MNTVMAKRREELQISSDDYGKQKLEHNNNCILYETTIKRFAINHLY